MAKFTSKAAVTKRPSRAVIQTETQTPNAVTYEGGPAYTRTSLSDLFLLGVVNFVSEGTFYEQAGSRDERFAKLARTVAVENPDWFAKFVKWLRAEGNMRSAPLVAAAQGVYARLNELRCSANGCKVYGEWVEDDKTNGRRCGEHRTFGKAVRDETSHKDIVASVLLRADEPGELLAYWAQTFGSAVDGGQVKAQLPKPVKRGIAKVIEGPSSLYSQYSALKYDTDGKSVRFADVLELVHPQAADETQGEFYSWLLDRRHGRDGEKEYPSLAMVNARKALQAIPQDQRKAFLAASAKDGAFAEDTQADLKAAGVTWEWLSSWLGSKLDASFWESMIPSMPYMATLRNLRNFDQAGISRDAAKSVAARLEDPRQVQRSRQFPYRFWSAYTALDSVTYAPALEAALDLSTQNIPSLGGRTLVLIDTSGSMTDTVTGSKSSMTRSEAGALFAFALAKKGEDVEVHGFGTTSYPHPINKGLSVLKETQRFIERGAVGGHGTAIGLALATTYKGHDRVIIFTDMQSADDASVSGRIPASIPIYGFNLGGYAHTAFPSKKNRYEIGGVTDQTFKQIKLLEQGKAGNWPWEEEK